MISLKPRPVYPQYKSSESLDRRLGWPQSEDDFKDDSNLLVYYFCDTPVWSLEGKLKVSLQILLLLLFYLIALQMRSYLVAVLLH
jgi:hypothetical protein